MGFPGDALSRELKGNAVKIGDSSRCCKFLPARAHEVSAIF